MGYAIGIDYGTNSVRGIVVDTADGRQIGQAVYAYPTGEDGIILDAADHNLARQNPADYLEGAQVVVCGAIADACGNDPNFRAADVIGIGVDTTGSTPLPVDADGTPLTLLDEFKDNPNAMAWLWKDHTSQNEATEITELAASKRPEYLAKCGGAYSSEWFFSKVLHCLRVDPVVFNAAYSWVEHADFMTALLTGTSSPDKLRRCKCAAGHKAMFSDEWGGYPDREFLMGLSPELGRFRDSLSDETFAVGTSAGKLTRQWADKFGLPEGIAVTMGAIDAHLGAVGSGICEGVMVKILGTSGCDLVVFPNTAKLEDIPGICGIVDGSILPGYFGLEAGQAAVGDIYNWFVKMVGAGKDQNLHVEFTDKAEKLKPGESGLLALDWNNGNRNILADQSLTGLLVGQTLHTKAYEIYRAMIEATAFGALMIINRFEEYGVKIDSIVACGGIAEKNDMLMRIYADVTGREIRLAGSSQACALGAAIAAAVSADEGGYDSFADAQKAMCSLKDRIFTPDMENHKTYQKLFSLYEQLHDAFGLPNYNGSLANVMKELLAIKESATS